jgi:hypothetical protein
MEEAPVKKRNVQWQVLALMVGLVLVVSAEARAQDAVVGTSTGNFGVTGQFVVSSDLKGEIGYTSVSGPGDRFLIDLRPAVDYFLRDNLSLGGTVLLGTAFQSGDNPLLVGLGVRAGYNIPMSETVSVWPKLGLAVVHSDGFLDFGERTFLEISLTAPFLVHVAPHFFIGGGPGLTTQLGDDTVATLNVSAVVGGYF